MTVNSIFSYGHLSDFLKSDFLFHIHFQLYPNDYIIFGQVNNAFEQVIFLKYLSKGIT
jgi:hypothetical protein